MCIRDRGGGGAAHRSAARRAGHPGHAGHAEAAAGRGEGSEGPVAACGLAGADRQRAVPQHPSDPRTRLSLVGGALLRASAGVPLVRGTEPWSVARSCALPQASPWRGGLSLVGGALLRVAFDVLVIRR